MPRLRLILTVAILAFSCNKDFPNPFESSNPTATPPPDAALLLTSNAYSSAGGATRDVFSLPPGGGELTRLTFCNGSARSCDNEEAASASDRKRIAVRRIARDTDGDGRLAPSDGEALVFIDLSRGVEGALEPGAARVTGLDWSATDDVIVYSAAGAGGIEDLFAIEPVNDADHPDNPHRKRTLTDSPDIRERRPRIDPEGNVAVFERIAGGGKGEIWVFYSRLNQVRVTSGGPGSAPLPGTPYVVGSDADPTYSPDGSSLVFRRLTGTGNDGLGTWDILTAATDGSRLTLVASSPVYRGAPDWGPQGIVFEEVDAEGGTAALVVTQPDGSGRRTLSTAGGNFRLTHPRWLR